jgi:hypothetical protein
MYTRTGERLGQVMTPYIQLAGFLGTNSFPSDVQAFLDQVSKDPKTHEKLLLAVKFHPFPWWALKEGLKSHSSSKVWDAILNSKDPNALATRVIDVLGAIRLQHRNTDSSFAQHIEAEENLREDLDTALICVIDHRHLRSHLTNALKVKTLTIGDAIKIGQKFFQGQFATKHYFPALSRRVFKSAVPETIFAHIGLDVRALALDRQKDPKAFKLWTNSACNQRRKARRAARRP